MFMDVKAHFCMYLPPRFLTVDNKRAGGDLDPRPPDLLTFTCTKASLLASIKDVKVRRSTKLSYRPIRPGRDFLVDCDSSQPHFEPGSKPCCKLPEGFLLMKLLVKVSDRASC